MGNVIILNMVDILKIKPDRNCNFENRATCMGFWREFEFFKLQNLIVIKIQLESA